MRLRRHRADDSRRKRTSLSIASYISLGLTNAAAFIFQAADITAVRMLKIAIASILWLSLPPHALSTRTQCRCFPGDDCWPSAKEWDHFNTTLDGKLVATVPLAAACHDSQFGVDFSTTECSTLREGWTSPENQ